MKRIIYYYQTFCGLKDLINNNVTNVTHIHLSAIHFGKDENNQYYIHLNNNIPYCEKYTLLWEELLELKNKGVKIILMIGGAGSAYNELFSNFDIYYNLLYTLLKVKSDIISGIDLDIEEEVSLENIKKLINKVKNDFGDDFIISMAPIQSSLENDVPGMGGFIYKDLYNSNEGKYIDYFNVQFYSDFTFNSYNNIINNNYPPEKIIMGMISGQNLQNNLVEIKKTLTKYNNFGGTFIWEYYNAIDNESPSKWADLVKEVYNSNYNVDNLTFVISNIYNYIDKLIN